MISVLKPSSISNGSYLIGCDEVGRKKFDDAANFFKIIQIFWHLADFNFPIFNFFPVKVSS